MQCPAHRTGYDRHDITRASNPDTLKREKNVRKTRNKTNKKRKNKCKTQNQEEVSCSPEGDATDSTKSNKSVRWCDFEIFGGSYTYIH